MAEANMTRQKLLTGPIAWIRVDDGAWRATVEGCECYLRMNDFPEEPLYTVGVGELAIDIEDAPAGWSIEW
jgi:hypothetical protein